MDRIAPELAWRKSSQSAQQDNCVEVANLPDGGYAIRDSKDSDGPVLGFADSDWKAFIGDVKSGAFDLLSC